MDWQDERYVRLYIRDTADWLTWPWQSRALFPLLMRKADRVGRVSMGRSGLAGLAVLVGLPEEVVTVGVTGLVEDGCVLQDETELLIKNFAPAQDIAKTDAQRQREHRAAQRSKALESKKLSEKSRESRTVTKVTPVTKHVTPSVPSLPSVPSSKEDLSPAPPATASNPPRVVQEPAAPKPAEVVYRAWARTLGKPDLPMGQEDWSILGARLKDGCTVEQLCQAAVGAKLDAERWPERKAQNEIKFVYGSMGQVRKFVDLAAAGNPRPLAKNGYHRAEDYKSNRPPAGEVDLSAFK